MTAQLALFDYATLDSETRIVVQQRTTEIKGLMRRAAQDIIEIGHKLIEVKARLGHGHFGGWLRAEFEWSDQTARNFMNVAQNFSQIQNGFEFAPRALYLLAAPSTPDAAREEALSRAEAGEPITYSAAREIVNGHKAPLPFEPSNFTPDYSDPYGDDEPELWEPETPAAQIVEPRPVAIVHEAAASVEWYTPARYLEAARATLGAIDLDPASNLYAQARVRATDWYGPDHPDAERRDGLNADWQGRVWLNPPYGAVGGRAVAAEWARRLMAAYDAGNVTAGILLVNAVIDSKWFDPLWRFPICLTNHRIQFDIAPGFEGVAPRSPVIGSAFVYLGSHINTFVSEFSHFGAVVTRLEPEHEPY